MTARQSADGRSTWPNYTARATVPAPAPHAGQEAPHSSTATGASAAGAAGAAGVAASAAGGAGASSGHMR